MEFRFEREATPEKGDTREAGVVYGSGEDAPGIKVTVDTGCYEIWKSDLRLLEFNLEQFKDAIMKDMASMGLIEYDTPFEGEENTDGAA